MEDLNIILDTERDENSSIETYLDNSIKKFVIYNREYLQDLNDILEVINDNYDKKNGTVNRLHIRNLWIYILLINIGDLLKRYEYSLLCSFRYIYIILRFLTLKLDLMIQDVRIEITDEQIENLHSLKERLVPRIQMLIQDLQNHYFEKNINIDYFIYLNMNNPMVLASVNNVKPTPGTFRLYQVLDDSKIDELANKFKYSFVDATSHFGAERFNRIPGNSFEDMHFDSYRADEHQNYARANRLEFNYSTDTEFKKYTGWSKKALREALTESGIFDSTVTKVDDGYFHQFPRLMELGISQPPVIKSIKPDAIIKAIPKYALEVLYAKTQNTAVNWKEILKSNPPMEQLRKLVRDELHLDIGDDNELKLRVKSIVRNQELSRELPELSQQLIMQPGTPTHPGVMYTKMAYQPEKFPSFVRPRVNIERYLSEINDICEDPTKGPNDAYQLAVDIGLQNYVRINEGKNRICQVLGNYLRVIREERIY